MIKINGFIDLFNNKEDEQKELDFITDGYFYSDFKNDLENKINLGFDESFKNLVQDNVENTFELLEKNKTVLAIGEVQSGKTQNLIGVSCLAADNNWDIIIILGGTTNTLLYQFLERFEKIIPKENDFVFFNFRKQAASLDLYLSEGKKVFINILKNNRYLESIAEEIENLNSKTRILIIDDECDFGSINTNKKSETKIYASLRKILQQPEAHYLGITATPYGNLVNDKSKATFPEVIIKLKRDRNNYTGIDFFQQESVYEIRDEFKNTQDNESLINEFFYNFVVKSAFLNYYGYKNMEGILNIDIVNERQDEFLLILNQAKTRVRDMIKKKRFDFFEKEINKVNKIAPFTFENLYETLSTPGNDVLIRVLNIRDNKVNREIGNVIYIGGILISRGVTFENLISEVMINLRNENQPVDILLQRARWFGYRKKEFKIQNNMIPQYKLMNIYINDLVKSCLEEAQDLNNELYNNVMRNVIHNSPFEIQFELNNYKNKMNLIKFSDKE